MDLKDILSVGLTPEDFDTIIKGLDAIPDNKKLEEGLRGATRIIVAAMISQRAVKEAQDLGQKGMKEAEKICEREKEDMVILKSKMILLKRLLLSNDAVKMANDILSTPPEIMQNIEYKQVV